MPRGIPLRTDYNEADLRRLSRTSPDSKQIRRLLALALTYEGNPRHKAAPPANVDVQSIRDWVLRFNAEGLIEGKSTGAPPTRLNAEQMVALARVVDNGPVPYLDGVVR